MLRAAAGKSQCDSEAGAEKVATAPPSSYSAANDDSESDVDLGGTLTSSDDEFHDCDEMSDQKSM